jgi:hypothetical protein
VRGVDRYLFLLPDGDGGHDAEPDRLFGAAVLQGWRGWLLGCRDQRPANDDPDARRVVVVTPLGMVGDPVGTLAGALARAGVREGCIYVLFARDAVPPAVDPRLS